MAEDSWWWTTDGVGDGTDAGYTAVEVAQFWRYLLTQDPTTECVVAGALNELAVTGTTSPVSMATGYAVVDGTAYKNDAAKDVAVGTPVVGTTGHRVVLRASWGATQETRVALLSSADGVAAIPSPTQTSGTLYEVSLATLTITTGGAITVTDDRGFCHFGTDISLGMMDANSVDSDQYVDGSIDLAHLSVNSVDSDQYVDGSIDLAHLSADCVDDTKVGNRVPALTRRQGGSATIWSTGGITDYTPTAVRMQCGAAAFASAPAAGTITFPTAFSYAPIVIVTAMYNVSTMTDSDTWVKTVTTTQASFHNQGTYASPWVLFWLAIGEE